MMITILSGGTGTLKLLTGMRTLLNDTDLTVVANTSDAVWSGGGHAAPETDNIMHLFAGILNPSGWNGIRGDTYSTHRYLKKIGRPEFFPVGDKARAVNIARAGMLNEGLSLTCATELLTGSYGIMATVLPVTDTPIQAYVQTETGRMHLLEYRERWRNDAGALSVDVEYETPPVATEKVLDSIKKSDAVILGPENPLTSIAPILSCGGLQDALKKPFVIAISPVRGRVPGEFLHTGTVEYTSESVFRLYEEFTDLFIQDTYDPCEIEGTLRLDTRMRNRAQCDSLAWDLMSIVRRKT